MLTLAVLAGYDEDRAADMDLISFNSLVESIQRVRGFEKTESAWTAMHAAQARGEDMKTWVGRWANDDEELVDDTEKFIGLAQALNKKAR